MVLQLFWGFAMVRWLEVVLDVSTREVVSFALSESPTFSGGYAILQKLSISGVHPGQFLEVDRSRLDVWVVPDTA
jgi:hypothetical protein